MEAYDGFTTKTVGQNYQTIVKEFDETRGLWEEVVYRTVDGIEYVESRKPVEIGTKTSSPIIPTGETSSVKPTPISKPVLTMTLPEKPVAYVESQNGTGNASTTPGPINQVESDPANLLSTESSTKYLYGYGIKNIAINNTTYESSGVFVSKPMTIKGNIVELSLLANEEHPLFDGLGGKASPRMTSVEYYIAYKNSPNANDWHPILPEGQTNVLSERLFFLNSTAKLRFYAKLTEETSVHKNGIKLSTDKWCFTEKGASLQLLEVRDLTAIYTINYTPDPAYYNPWLLKVTDKDAVRRTHTDLFRDGTSANKNVTLSYYPYTDYETINKAETFDANIDVYRPFKVYLQNAQIAISGGKNVDTVLPQANAVVNTPFTKNVTDYKNGINKALNPYSINPDSKYLGFEYKQERNQLVFSETFNRATINGNENEVHGNAEIAVEYEYLETNFRIKIIVRKNSGNNIIMSPRVNDYQIKFKVMK
jgi:hypothetical protein